MGLAPDDGRGDGGNEQANHEFFKLEGRRRFVRCNTVSHDHFIMIAFVDLRSRVLKVKLLGFVTSC